MVNPFQYSTPIIEPARFIGRKYELKRIIDRSYQASSTSIVGERRIGKTSILRFLTHSTIVNNFGEEFILVYNDMQGYEQAEPNDFWLLILTELIEHIKEHSLQLSIQDILDKKTFDNTTINRLFKKLSSKKIILLFDEFEAILQNKNFLPSFYGRLRWLNQNCSVAFVTSTRNELIHHCIDDETKSSPFFNIFANLIVRPFEDTDCINLIRKYLKNWHPSFSS